MSKALLALALACPIAAAWTASDATIHDAVRLWLSERAAAEVKYGHISTWETGGVTDMSMLFCVRSDAMETAAFDGCEDQHDISFDDDISEWDTSGVTTMILMFHGAMAFNQPLNGWSVDQVTEMDGMFLLATSFNQPLKSWNVAKVTSMTGMFRGASSFNRPIGGWNVDKVTNMNSMFR